MIKDIAIGQLFDVHSEVEVYKKLAEFERGKLENILLNSNNPVIQNALNEALAIVKLVLWEDLQNEFEAKEKSLHEELEIYNRYSNKEK